MIAMHSEIQIISILFTCLYNNNTLADSEIHQFINSEFQNYRLRLEWPLEEIHFRNCIFECIRAQTAKERQSIWGMQQYKTSISPF